MPSRSGLSVVREAPRSIGERAAVMSAFQDEIAGIFEDIARYSMGDARIQECLEEAMKRITAEVDALVFEAAELVRATTESERLRIATAQPDEGWYRRELDWRGNDYLEGAAE